MKILRNSRIYAILPIKLWRFSDKTVRNLRVSECHESVLSNEQSETTYDRRTNPSDPFKGSYRNL